MQQQTFQFLKRKFFFSINLLFFHLSSLLQKRNAYSCNVYMPVAFSFSFPFCIQKKNQLSFQMRRKKSTLDEFGNRYNQNKRLRVVSAAAYCLLIDFTLFFKMSIKKCQENLIVVIQSFTKLRAKFWMCWSNSKLKVFMSCSSSS